MRLAGELGWFGDAPVRMVELTSATHVLQSFRSGVIDAATTTLDEALLLAEDVPDVRMVLFLDASSGADVILGRPGVSTLQDLRGKRIGYEATALGAYMLSRMLDTGKLGPADIQSVTVRADEHERVFKHGEVDAIVTFEPVRTRLLASGAKVLFDSSQIPGEIWDVLMVRGEYLRRNPKAVAAILRGWFRSLDYLQQCPDEAAKRLGARLGVSPADSAAMYQRILLPDWAENKRLLGGSNPAIRPIAARLADMMRRHRLLERDIPLADLFDPGPLDGLQASSKEEAK